MSIEQVATLATFGSIWAILAVSHNLADHIFGQTDRQAACKAAPSAAEVAAGVSTWRGWGACLTPGILQGFHTRPYAGVVPEPSR